MGIPSGTLVDDKFVVFHEGNHNEIGNPHDQYNIPVYSTLSNVILDSTQVVKIMSFTTTYPKFKFSLFANVWSYCIGNMGTKGNLVLDLEGFSDGTYIYTLKFLNLNPNQLSYFNHFYLYVTNLGNNLYTFDLYYQFQTDYETLRFTPIINEYQANKTWSVYDFKNVIRQSDIFLRNQDIIIKSSITATLLTGSKTLNDILYVSSLPVPSQDYDSKIVYLLQSGSSPARGFIGIKTGSGSYVWDRINQSAVSKTMSGGETTIDSSQSDIFNLNNSTATIISSVANGFEGKIITFLSFNANTTIQNGSSIYLKGGANAVVPNGGVLVLRYMTGKWYEVSRNF